MILKNFNQSNSVENNAGSKRVENNAGESITDIFKTSDFKKN